ASKGTKLTGANFQCLMSGTPISGDYIKAEGKAGRISSRLMAIVAEGKRERVFLPPAMEHEEVAKKARPGWKPEVNSFQEALGFRIGNYGMTMWSDLFTERQLVALTTFSDLVPRACEDVQHDCVVTGIVNDGRSLHDGGSGASAYGEAVAVYLACALSR